MAKIEYSAECLCGGKMLTTFKNPTRFQHSVSRVTCGGCGSEFMFLFSVEYDENNVRAIMPTHEAINLTPKLLDAIKKHNEKKVKEAKA